ncbi:MAG TPA: gas vesicle protein GvpO [Streptosporangiaceae bacterium]|nr:gas vesicle protein GvpO [Streptosporangiaceae bacterium]
MAERRKGSASTRSRQPSDRDEREEIDEEEPEPLEDEELVDAEEPEEDGQSRPAMSAGEAAKAALRQIATLTSKQPEGITEIARTEDGWTVGVELLEDQRIPSSADILATYETTVDADGELVSYRRVRRYARGRGDAEEK